VAVDIDTTSFVMIPLEKIVSKLGVRRLSPLGVKKLVESMKWAGFLESYPLIVVLLEDGTYLLIDGNHRYEAAKELGISLAPCVTKTDLPELDRYKLAIQANTATESATYHNLVTNSEFIWARLAEVDERDLGKPPEKQRKKYTQSQVGEMLGWGRDKVNLFAALQKICPEAWNIIATTFEKTATFDENGVVATDATTLAFTERLLRSILDLTPEQQTELVTSLATNSNFSKGKFKTLAENYQGRNQAYIYALQKLGVIDEDIKTEKVKEVLEDTEDKIAKEFLG
jgi:ParB-like chromosome segregation protein Spo0J